MGASKRQVAWVSVMRNAVMAMGPAFIAIVGWIKHFPPSGVAFVMAAGIAYTAWQTRCIDWHDGTSMGSFFGRWRCDVSDLRGMALMGRQLWVATPRGTASVAEDLVPSFARLMVDRAFTQSPPERRLDPACVATLTILGVAPPYVVWIMGGDIGFACVLLVPAWTFLALAVLEVERTSRTSVPRSLGASGFVWARGRSC